MSDLLPTKAPAQLPPEQGYPNYGPTDAYGEMPGPPPARVQRFFMFLRKLWWVPLITLVLCLGGASVYVIFWMPPTYVSIARMWETEKLNLPGGAAFTADVQTYLGTQMELLKSAQLKQMANTQVQLWYSTNKFLPKDKDGIPVEPKLKMGQAPRSSVFYVEASGPYPEYTRDYLKAITDKYLDYKKQIRESVSSGTIGQVKKEIEMLESKLKASRQDYSDFQKSNNLAVLTQQAGTAGAYLTRLRGEVSDLELEKKLLEDTALDQDNTATNSGAFLADSLLGGRSSSASSTVTLERQAAFKELQVLQIQRDKLSKYLRPKHPKIFKLDTDIERAKKIVDIYRRQSGDQLAVTRKGLDMRIESTKKTIEEWETQVDNFSALMAEARQLEGEVTRNQGMYEQLQKMQQNVEIGTKIDLETLAILDEAGPAIRSYKEGIMILGLGLFVGLALGFGIVFLVEIRDDRFSTLTEVNEKISDNIVGQVPEVVALEPDKPLPLLDDNDERHMFAESYRSLRSALLYLPFEGQRPKIILVTSAMPNEGKSTISANLARAVAMGGSRVLLVDADLRKGLLHEMLGLQREPGLAELLRKPDELYQVIQRNSHSNLAFISRGRASAHPGDLFLGPALDQLLARWREDFDCVIIDSCPVFAADDASTLAPKVDGTLFVVRSRFSSARATREALDLLYKRQAKILGLIYNRANSSANSYYYYKYSQYAGSGEKKAE